MDGIWKVCPEAGGPIQFPGFNGDYAVLFCLFLIVKISVFWFLYTKFLFVLFLALGELICPVYHELCSSAPVPVVGHCPNSCDFNGDCVDGRCHCFLGFHGHDCSKRELFVSLSLHSIATNLSTRQNLI